MCLFNKVIQDLNSNYACSFFLSFKKIKILLLLLLLGCARSHFDWPITKKTKIGTLDMPPRALSLFHRYKMLAYGASYLDDCKYN
jgi:hypothetical protein